MSLDVRSLPTWQRHPMILSAFDGLREGEALLIINDHEPRPLRAEFEELRPGRYLWSTRNLGNELLGGRAATSRAPAQRENTIEAVLRRAAAFAAGSGANARRNRRMTSDIITYRMSA